MSALRLITRARATSTSSRKRMGNSGSLVKGDHYTYTPEIMPENWEALGTFHPEGIYDDQHKATFVWKRDNDGKSVAVRFLIEGDDKERFEKEETGWRTLEYCRDAPPPQASPSPAVALGPSSPPPGSPVPPRRAIPVLPETPVQSEIPRQSDQSISPKLRAIPDQGVPRSAHTPTDPCRFTGQIARGAIATAIDQLGSDDPVARSNAITRLSYTFGPTPVTKDLILLRLRCTSLSERARVNGLTVLARQPKNSWTCDQWRNASTLLDRLAKQHSLTRAEGWAYQQLDAALAEAQRIAPCDLPSQTQ